jgi:large repetitive protein
VTEPGGCTSTDPNYTLSLPADVPVFTITQGTPVVKLNCSKVSYNGSPQACSPGAQAYTGNNTGITIAGTYAPLTYTGITDPSYGPTTAAPTNAGDYTVAGGTFTPTDTVNWAGGVTGSSATMTISLVSAPVASDQTVSTNANTPVSITLHATSNPTSYTAGTAANGTVTCVIADCTYTPNANFTGTDSFTFTATNLGGTSAAATVTINVQGMWSSPASGSGTTGTPQTFTLTYNNTTGSGYIGAAEVLFNNTANYAGGCALWYDNEKNLLFMFDGSSWGTSVAAGATATLNSATCSVDASQVVISNTTNQLQITLPVTFKPGFVNSKNVYGRLQTHVVAEDILQTADTGFYQVGTWMPGTQLTGAPTVTVTAGTGNAGTLSVKLSSVNGYAYVNAANIIINSAAVYENGCVVWFDRGGSRLYLWNGSGWTAPVVVGVTGSLSNAQCSINTGTSSIANSGNDVTLNLDMTFANGFIGAAGQNVYAWVNDKANANNGGYPQVATWGAAAAAPALVSVAQVNGKVELVFADANGFSYINAANVIINSRFDYTGACAVWFDRSGNKVLLYNGSTWDMSPIGAGGTTLTNSQCSLDGAASTVSGSGNTLTLDLALSFAGMTGTQNVYVWSNDKANATTGFQTSTTTIPLP